MEKLFGYRTFVSDKKLNETLDKARKILGELKIPEEDKRFQTLRKLLNNNLGYLGQFTKWYLQDHESWDKIMDTYVLLRKVGADKEIDSFETIENLHDYLLWYEKSNKARHILNTYLPGVAKQYINDNLVDAIGNSLQYKDILVKFYKEQQPKILWTCNHWAQARQKPEYRNFRTPADWLYDELKIKLNGIETGHNLGAKLKLMKDNGVKVAFPDKDPVGDEDVTIIIISEKILMVEVLNVKACALLGSQNWCIRQKSYWDTYVGFMNKQFLIWDFTKSVLDEKNLLGATLSVKGEIIHAQYDSRKLIPGSEMERYIKELDDEEKEYEKEKI